MDELRGRSKPSSQNSSRESPVHSDLSSVPYVDRMEAQNNDPSWANQMEMENFQLSYTTPKKRVSNVQNEATNLNHTLRGIKSNSIIDFIYIGHCGLIVTANKVAIPSELCVAKNYIKNTTSVDLNDVQSTYLLQSKLYLKILGILL